MTAKEKQVLINSLRDLRNRLEAPKPASVDALSHYAELVGRAAVVIDSALVTLSTNHPGEIVHKHAGTWCPLTSEDRAILRRRPYSFNAPTVAPAVMIFGDKEDFLVMYALNSPEAQFLFPAHRVSLREGIEYRGPNVVCG